MLRHLLRPVVLPDLEPSFPVMPKGKIMGERGLELWVQQPCCPVPPYRASARLRGDKDPFPNNQRSSQQHSHCYCTSSRLNGAPDTNGFPGSRAQHEASEGPEVTVCVKLSGFCSANTHQPSLLTAIMYFLESS